MPQSLTVSASARDVFHKYAVESHGKGKVVSTDQLFQLSHAMGMNPTRQQVQVGMFMLAEQPRIGIRPEEFDRWWDAEAGREKFSKLLLTDDEMERVSELYSEFSELFDIDGDGVVAGPESKCMLELLSQAGVTQHTQATELLLEITGTPTGSVAFGQYIVWYDRAVKVFTHTWEERRASMRKAHLHSKRASKAGEPQSPVETASSATPAESAMDDFVTGARCVFVRADSDGNGQIDVDELAWCMQELRRLVKPGSTSLVRLDQRFKDAASAMLEFDQNGDGELNFDEFLSMFCAPPWADLVPQLVEVHRLTQWAKEHKGWSWDNDRETQNTRFRTSLRPVAGTERDRHHRAVALEAASRGVLRTARSLFGGIDVDGTGQIHRDELAMLVLKVWRYTGKPDSLEGCTTLQQLDASVADAMMLYDSECTDSIDLRSFQRMLVTNPWNTSLAPQVCQSVMAMLRCRQSTPSSPEHLSLIHISEPTRLLSISYAVFCLKKKKTKTTTHTYTSTIAHSSMHT
eukprot:TRINITY_DN7290_c0_g1_i1.p1 TRINITY_DN7290_c0_g1~~TRINITY_DN7290_c0_g1_i1.p1  ORF type:complete len:518 (+),score=121.01 TRINITY_DN7290_c0_g1_i1:222-1775(+)